MTFFQNFQKLFLLLSQACSSKFTKNLEKQYYSRDKEKSKEQKQIYVENPSEYHTERHIYKSMDKKKHK